MPLIALWSFASPWLLLWGAAAALPVLIHLWSRRRYLETPWAATQFLLAAIRRHQRRIQIEQWLLLAVRGIILLLLAIALAEPIVSGLVGGADPTSRAPMHKVLVIDTSYSMEYESANITRLSRAKSQAIKLVEEAAPGDAFSLVTLADPPEVIIGPASTSHTAVLDEINRLQIAYRGADVAATLEQIDRLLTEIDGVISDRTVHFFTDLGQTTWSDSLSNDWRAKLASLSQRVACRLTVTSTGDTPDNSAITRLASPSRNVIIGTDVSIVVTIQNFSRHPQSRKRVELTVDGQIVGEQFVDLEANGEASARFKVTFHVTGDHILKASIGRDGLNSDNTRWLSVPVRDATRILCVQGRPHAAAYIALALQPTNDFRELQVEVASEHAILERSLRDYECLFLCNVARVTSEEAQRLRQYVEQGGGLIVVLGDLVRTELYNEQLGPESPTALLPANLQQIIGDARHTFDPLEYRHALVRPFRGHERSGLLTVPIWRYVHLTKVDPSANIAIAFDNGDPAIIESTAGQGRVVLIATAASPESVDSATDPPTPWTALASWPSFPPLMHEIVDLAASNRSAQRNVLIGELLAFQFPSGLSKLSGTLTRPDETQLPLRPDPDNRIWTYGHTDQPGVYRLALDDETISPASFTANLSTAESDLEAVTLDSVADFFETQGPVEARASPDLPPREVPLFRLALGGLLLVLVTETFLACRFGRASR